MLCLPSARYNALGKQKALGILTVSRSGRYTKQREYVFRLFLTIKYMYMMIGAASRGWKLQLMTFDMMIYSLMLKSDLKLVVKKKINA